MAPQGVQMKFQGVQNTTFDENPQENERIWAILGCAISSIARAKHGCTGGWLKLWFESSLSKITRPVAAIKSLRFALFCIKFFVSLYIIEI